MHLRRQTSLNADLSGPQVPSLASAAHYLPHGDEVALFLAMVPTKGAETAALYTDVGEVDVAIDYVCDYVAHCASAQLVGDQHQRAHLQTGDCEQSLRLLGGDILPQQGTVQDGRNLGLHGRQQPFQGAALRLTIHLTMKRRLHSVEYPPLRSRPRRPDRALAVPQGSAPDWLYTFYSKGYPGP